MFLAPQSGQVGENGIHFFLNRLSQDSGTDAGSLVALNICNLYRRASGAILMYRHHISPLAGVS